MHIALLNYLYDAQVADPDELIARYATLAGWGEALLEAGATRVTVAQRFGRDASFSRGGVRYLLRADGGAGRARPWNWPQRLHHELAVLRPDLAHINGLMFPAQTLLLRRALPDAALLVQDHKERPAAGLRRVVQRVGLRVVDGFLFTAAALACPWRAAGLIMPQQRVYELPEGSRQVRQLPRAAARATSGVGGDPALLWVGRLDANKDPLVALAGFARVLAQLPGAQLNMIYGSDELLPQVRALLTRTPALHGRVRLLGQLPPDRMAACYRAADLFVLSSHYEGSSYALLEALACGLTPVATDIPSNRALAGPIGLFWQPGNAVALADALAAAAQRDQNAARVAVLNHYERVLSWPAVGRRAMAIYRGALMHRRDAEAQRR